MIERHPIALYAHGCYVTSMSKNERDFPQTKLDSEMNAPFLLNEQGDPHFLFFKFSENNILNN